MKSNINNRKTPITILFVLATVLISCRPAMSITLPKNPKGIQIIDRAIGWQPVTGQPVYARLYRNYEGNVIFEILKEKTFSRNDWESIFMKNFGNIDVPDETILDIRSDAGLGYMRFLILSEFYGDADSYFLYDLNSGKITER